jgi:hypothetical protein
MGKQYDKSWKRFKGILYLLGFLHNSHLKWNMLSLKMEYVVIAQYVSESYIIIVHVFVLYKN